MPKISYLCKKNMLSIIIPIYNSEKYVQRCLDSIVSQTNKNFEVILIDDGSKDKTLEILRDLSKEKKSRDWLFSQSDLKKQVYELDRKSVV